MTDLTPSASTGDLGKRIASGVVMALLAVGAVVLGGWPFALFWAAAAVGIFWEWSTIVAGGAIAARAVGIAALIAATLAAGAALRSDPFIRWGDGTVEGATPAYVRLSAPANVTGLPSLSVPAAFTADGLPLGVQIIGKPFAEPEILQFGYALEQNTDVVGRIAPVVAKAAH